MIRSISSILRVFDDTLFTEECERAEMWTIYEAESVFGKKAKELPQDSDEAWLYSTLHKALVCECHNIVPGEICGPSFEETRFFDEQIELVVAVSSETQDLRLKAFLSDFVFSYAIATHSKNIPSYARIAFDALMAAPLDRVKHPMSNDVAILSRTIHLAKNFRKLIPNVDEKISAKVLSVIRDVSSADHRFVCEISRILYETKFIAVSREIKSALLKICRECSASGDMMNAQDCLLAVTAWTDSEEEKVQVQAQLAQAYFSEAEALEDAEQVDCRCAGRIPWLYERAISTFHLIPRNRWGEFGFDDKIDGRLRLRMNQAQQKLFDHSVSHVKVELPVCPQAHGLVDTLRGRPIREQLAILCELCRIDSSTIEEALDKYAHDKIWAFAFPITVYESEGRKALNIPGGLCASNDEAELNSGYRRSFAFSCALQSLVCYILYPGYRIVIDEHEVGERSDRRLTYELVTKSKVVPSGHIVQFAEGLSLGLEGNMLSAVGILIPQIEASVRNLLSERGVVVSRIDPNGVEETLGLSTLIRNSALDHIVNPVLLFEMRQLFGVYPCLNLRNRFSHGLLLDGEMNSPDKLYVWLVALKLVLNGWGV